MSDDTQHLVIERTLAASPAVVWSLWTDPKAFAAWYGPEGASIPVAQMDVREGGERLLCMEMSTPDGAMQMWFAGTYLEVVENERLVYTDSMADENGTIKTAEQMGMPEGHATTTEVRVELEPVSGGTKMVLTHIGIAADSPGAAGWMMALDKLASQAEDQDNLG